MICGAAACDRWMLGSMNDEWLERYSRQILLAEIDFAGQEAIVSASVAIVVAVGWGR